MDFRLGEGREIGREGKMLDREIAGEVAVVLREDVSGATALGGAAEETIGRHPGGVREGIETLRRQLPKGKICFVELFRVDNIEHMREGKQVFAVSDRVDDVGRDEAGEASRTAYVNITVLGDAFVDRFVHALGEQGDEWQQGRPVAEKLTEEAAGVFGAAEVRINLVTDQLEELEAINLAGLGDADDGTAGGVRVADVDGSEPWTDLDIPTSDTDETEHLGEEPTDVLGVELFRLELGAPGSVILEKQGSVLGEMVEDTG